MFDDDRVFFLGGLIVTLLFVCVWAVPLKEI